MATSMIEVNEQQKDWLIDLLTNLLNQDHMAKTDDAIALQIIEKLK